MFANTGSQKWSSFIYGKDVNIDKLSLQKEEVESVEWFNIDDICQAYEPPRDDAFCVPTGGLDLVVGYLIKNRITINDSFEIIPEIVTIAESSKKKMAMFLEELSRRLQEKTKKSEARINQRQQEVSKYKSMLGIKQNSAPKIYPNDPCPCGSGLKYKKCCGKK